MRAEHAPAGGLRLAVPDGYSARWLSDPDDREAIERFTADSPDACVYHSSSYVDFARRQNGHGDVVWLVRDGQPVLGLPVHPVDAVRMTSGYSGLLIPSAPGSSALRRGVDAMLALLAANERTGFQVLQCAQGPAYADAARMTELACLFDQHSLAGPALYTRVLGLEALEGPPTGEVDLSAERLLEQGLGPYQAELRNQIRQAIRHEVSASCSLPSNDAEVEEAYRDFLPLHRESWARTGMSPHSSEYWSELARAILGGGGRDLVVYARDGDGTTLAAVTCHLRDGRALYWASASAERGLKLRANPLCLHAAIQACQQLGVRHFELGRFDAREPSEKERSITRYKAQFGGRLLPIVGFQTDPPLAAVVLRRALGLLKRQP